MKIKVVCVGKIKERIYKERIYEYLKWINRDIKIELIALKDNNKKNLDKSLKKHLNNNYLKICVSQKGTQYSSKKFSKFLFDQDKDLAFFIGGPEGHSEIIVKSIKNSLSLSTFTMPHEMALLVLIEQIYRALQIKKGGSYHR